ncbi:MAG: FtsK/SpoIIIE domain-containing protein [Phormidesmis sp.]
MSILQTVRSHLVGDSPTQTAHPNVMTADPAVRLQVELREVIADLLQAQTPEAQAEIYQAVALELRETGVTYDQVQTALCTIYPDNRADAQLITDNLAAHGYGRPSQTTAIQADIEKQPSSLGCFPTAPTAHAVTTTELPPTYSGQIDYYEGSLLAETIAGGAFSAAIVGAPKAGASTLMRAFIWSMIYEPLTIKPGLCILDCRCGYWQGLDTLPGVVMPIAVTDMEAVAAIARQIEAVYEETELRQRTFRSKGRFGANHSWKPYLLGIDGWGEVMDYIAARTPKQIEDDEILKPMFTQLRYILSQGPDVGVSCLLTARSHDRVLPDNRSLGETRLLLLGRLTEGYLGGYGPLDLAINDKSQVPGHSDRARLMALLNQSKQLGQPVIVSLSGQPRMTRLPDLSEHNHHDFAKAYSRFKPY